MGICDRSLRDMSLTHNVLNDTFVLKTGLYSATLVSLPVPNEQIINFATKLHYYDTVFYEWSSKFVM